MPTYAELLLSNEWQEKRKTIIERDQLECMNCQNERLFTDRDLKLAFLKTPLVYNNYYVIGNEISSFKTVRFYSTALLMELVKNNNLIAYFLTSDDGYNNIQLIREASREELIEYRDIPFELIKNEIDGLDSGRPNFHEILVELNTREFHDETTFYQKFNRNLSVISIARENELKWKLVKGLHVHHTYYKKDLLPWEYPDNSLTTFCQYCHLELHSNTKIPVLDKNNKEIEKLTACHRCGGSSWFPEFKHVEDGICFWCRGARYEELISVNN